LSVISAPTDEVPAAMPYYPTAGHTSERITFFTDAVFAIAMTLLVIEIPRPDGSDFETGHGVSKSLAFTRLARFLWAQHSSYWAYLLAFLILWILWREHHGLGDLITGMSTRMIQLHFPLLVLAAFLPYTTYVLGHYPDNPMAALLFGAVAGVLFLCRSAIQQRADRDGVLKSEVDVGPYRVITTVSWIVSGYWIATLAVVWWTPWGQIPWFLTSAVAAVSGHVLRSRLARTTPPDAPAAEPDAPAVGDPAAEPAPKDSPPEAGPPDDEAPRPGTTGA
jgi:uncharacterized membrane protein